LIDTEDLVSRLTTGQTLNTSLSFLLRLKEEGRKRADAWLAQHRGALGWYSSVDIDKVFGGPMMNGVKQKLAADNTENSDQI
jgi:NTE family protein